MKTTVIIIMLIGTMLAQNIYEVTPGTKGNEIKLTIANVSETNAATNVFITLTKKIIIVDIQPGNRNDRAD